jgi:hypothetical protein
VEALELKGVPVAGTNKSKAIGTILWRLRDQFTNLTGFGYWPVDLDCPAAGYTAPKKEDTHTQSAAHEEPDILS